jgi:cysteine desulfurase/selenocysteine lyase
MNATPGSPALVEQIRAQFPILREQANGKPLVYLDNAATTQKPEAVLEATDRFYRQMNSNVHRAAHALSARATEAFEHARQTVADFINAQRHEIIWTRGTTESINLVASSYGRERLQPGDEVLITAMEHHSNIVPWQLACEKTGATLRVVPLLDNGSVDLVAFEELLSDRTRIVAITHVSNALGTVNPVADMVGKARDAGAVTLVDGAQAVAHFNVDVQKLGCDFYAFSGHKIFGPNGIGVLYGREALLDTMPPYHGGGEMIETVTFDGSTWAELPFKFEAGTPNTVGAIGLGAALAWLNEQDRKALAEHESDLIAHATERARATEGLRIIGDAPMKTGVLSFLLDGTHPGDVGTLLDQQGIAVRTGHHCCMPLMQRYGIPGTVRAAFSIYNTREEVDALFTGIEKVKTFL